MSILLDKYQSAQLLDPSSHHQQKSPKCSTWIQSQKRQNDLCSSPRKTIQYHSYPSLFPYSNAKETEIEWSYEDLQDLLE